MPDKSAAELKAAQSHILVSVESVVSVGSILDPTRFSTLTKLIGVIAMILKAVQRFKNAKSTDQPPVHIMDEHRQAELLWVKCAQRTISDIKDLTKQLNLF